MCTLAGFGEGCESCSIRSYERFLEWIEGKYEYSPSFVGMAVVAGDDGRDGDDENGSSSSTSSVVENALRSDDKSMASWVAIGGRGSEGAGGDEKSMAHKGGEGVRCEDGELYNSVGSQC
jgi:hypothetical protein